MRLALSLFTVLGGLSYAVAQEQPSLDNPASFDCSKASTPDERAICANPALAEKDEEVSDTYSSILPLLTGERKRQLVESQREWLQARARCGNDLSCLRSQYNHRSEQLQSMLTGAQSSTALQLFKKTAQCASCDLSGADLSGIKPAETVDDGLMQCNVNGSANGTFDGARIDHADFLTCGTKAASALNNMSWDGASLKGTDFTGTDLGGNSFKNADLTGANLSGANLFWVDMSNAKLAQANLTGAQSTPDVMNGICSDFTNADFSGAKAEKAELCGSFYNANFAGANLRGAKIYGNVRGLSKRDANAYPVETDPPDTSPSTGRFDGKINLTGANLTGATLFSETELTPHGYAFAILCHTKMPDGTISNRDCK